MILIPGIAAVVCAFVAVAARRRGERRTVLWVGIAALVGGLCWLQPAIEQAAPGEQGNFSRLLHGASDEAPTPDAAYVVEMMADTLAVPPMWLPPSFGDPVFLASNRPTWLVGPALAALVAGLAVLGWRARQRGSSLVATGAALCLAAMMLGFVTLWRMPIRMGPATQYTRFLWPLGMVVWVVLLLGVADELRLRRPAVQRLAVVVPALAVVAALAALPTVDNGGTNPAWSVAAIHALDDDILAAVDGREGAVLVEPLPHPTSLHMAPAVMSVLQDAGVPFYVTDRSMSRHVGESRYYEPGDASWQLTVMATPPGTASRRRPSSVTPRPWSAGL